MPQFDPLWFLGSLLHVYFWAVMIVAVGAVVAAAIYEFVRDRPGTDSDSAPR